MLVRCNIGIAKLSKFMATTTICVHVMGCFWYLTAATEEFHPDTWVARKGLVGAPD